MKLLTLKYVGEEFHLRNSELLETKKFYFTLWLLKLPQWHEFHKTLKQLNGKLHTKKESCPADVDWLLCTPWRSPLCCVINWHKLATGVFLTQSPPFFRCHIFFRFCDLHWEESPAGKESWRSVPLLPHHFGILKKPPLHSKSFLPQIPWLCSILQWHLLCMSPELYWILTLHLRHFLANTGLIPSNHRVIVVLIFMEVSMITFHKT